MHTELTINLNSSSLVFSGKGDNGSNQKTSGQASYVAAQSGKAHVNGLIPFERANEQTTETTILALKQ